MKTYNGIRINWLGEGFYYLHSGGLYRKSFKKMLISFLNPKFVYIMEHQIQDTGEDSTQFINQTFNAMLDSMGREEALDNE